MASEYRPCVVAVFTNEHGEILAGERGDVQGAWQLPQGGIDPGESALNALYREVREELGCDDFKVMKEASGLIKYKFPEDLSTGPAKKWIGQSQVWFLAKFDAGKGPDLSKSDGEFRRVRWMKAKDLIEGIIAWKKEAYREGFSKLGLI